MSKIKAFITGIIIVFVFGVVYFLSYNMAEPKAYDFMIKNVFVQNFGFDKQKQVYGSDDIVLIVVDEKTTGKYRWPWKRDVNCKIFGYLLEYAKPKVVVDDSIITTLDKENPQSDKKYFDMLKCFDNLVVGFSPSMFQWEDAKIGKSYEKVFSKKYGISVNNQTSPAYIIFHSMLKSPQEYLDVIKNMGHVYSPSGSLSRNISTWAFDEIIRTQEPLLIYNNAIYPSLAMRTLLLVKNNPKITLTDKVLKIGDDEISLLNKTYSYSNYSKFKFQTVSCPTRYYKLNEVGYSHIKYSALDIMDSYDLLKSGKKPLINPAEFKDKIVVVGANVKTSVGLNDNKSTPVATIHPGVDIQATAVDNLIHNDFMKVMPDWVNLLVMLLCILGVFFGVKIFDLAKSIFAAFGIVIAYLLISLVCFYFGIVIWTITPLVMFVLTTVFAYTYKYVIENRNKEKVKSAMGKYMSEGVMKDVIKNIDNLGLGGKKAVVTVLFADIRGFTSMSEKMSAQQVSEILNEYFTEMEPIITGYNGIINKFIGDAIMAVFGEPIQDEKHARNAVKCAYAMLEKLKVLNRKWARENKPEINIGVGINTGEVFIGNIGSVNRMEYTVIGDTVNLASRLESYNKIYRTKILISPTTYSSVKDIADVIKISDVRIRGKANKIDIYEILKVKL